MKLEDSTSREFHVPREPAPDPIRGFRVGFFDLKERDFLFRQANRGLAWHAYPEVQEGEIFTLALVSLLSIDRSGTRKKRRHARLNPAMWPVPRLCNSSSRYSTEWLRVGSPSHRVVDDFDVDCVVV